MPARTREITGIERDNAKDLQRRRLARRPQQHLSRQEGRASLITASISAFCGIQMPRCFGIVQHGGPTSRESVGEAIRLSLSNPAASAYRAHARPEGQAAGEIATPLSAAARSPVFAALSGTPR